MTYSYDTPFLATYSRLFQSSEYVWTDTAALPMQLCDLLDEIPPVGPQGTVRRIFTELIKLLDYVDVVDRNIYNNAPQQATLFVLAHIRKQGRALIVDMRKSAEDTDELSQSLCDALDCAGWAMSVELERVFRHELPDLAEMDNCHPDRLQLEKATGLLSNCFQQSIVIVSQVYAPDLQTADLFADVRKRRRHSVALFKDLGLLVDLCEKAENESDAVRLGILIAELGVFRSGSLRHLMPKDRLDAAELIHEMCVAEPTGRIRILHKLRCYFQTLHAQVSMRTTLSDFYHQTHVMQGGVGYVSAAVA